MYVCEESWKYSDSSPKQGGCLGSQHVAMPVKRPALVQMWVSVGHCCDHS